jgi:3-phosphoshikimate 1-carboxyvinyltransferase
MMSPTVSGRLSTRVFGPPAEPVDQVWVGAPYASAGPKVLGAHADKAISQRATILGALADGESVIGNLADCRDVRRNLDALSALGVPIRPTGEAAIAVTGRHPREWRSMEPSLDVGNSATTSRLLIAVLASGVADYVVTGNDLLCSRPMAEVIDPLRELGANLTELGAPGRLPVKIGGTSLKGGEVRVSVDSAQPVSALLFAGLHATDPVTIRRRTPARDHTERLLRWSGVPITEAATVVVVQPARPTPFELRVPGDPSGAAFLAALHLASPQATETLTIPGVGINPRRIGFFHTLAEMGIAVEIHGVHDSGPEPTGDVHVRRSGDCAGVELSDPQVVQSMIDEIPLLAALSTVAAGPTCIRNASELSSKDTDRIAATVSLLSAFGCHAKATEDGLIVHPGSPRAGARVDLGGDHRLVFAAMVLAVLSGGDVELRGVGAAATSHPGALADLAHWAPVESR